MYGKNGKISKVPSTETEALSSSKYTANQKLILIITVYNYYLSLY